MSIRKRAFAVGGSLTLAAALAVPASPATAVEVCDLSIATIVSTGGQDVIGTNGDDVVVYKNEVSTRVWLGAGNDKICIQGRAAPSFIEGNAGNDQIFFNIPAKYTAPVSSTLYLDSNDNSGTGNDTVRAASTNQDNVALTLSVYPGNGDNIVILPKGENFVWAGTGNDTIQGGAGKDILLDAGGKNWIKGGAGNDQINIGSTSAFTNQVWGEDGNDIITGGEGADTILGGAGNDRIRGNGGNDTIDGGDGYDELLGGAGNDSILGGAKSDCIDGENGNDTIDAGADADYETASCTNSAGVKIRGVHGGSGNDIVRGGAGGDTLFGDAGADQLFGDDGNDIIYFDPSDTVVNGGAGANDLRPV